MSAAIKFETVDEIRAGKAVLIRLHGRIAGPSGNEYRFLAARAMHRSRKSRIKAVILTSAGRRPLSAKFNAMREAVQDDPRVNIIFKALS